MCVYSCTPLSAGLICDKTTLNLLFWKIHCIIWYVVPHQSRVTWQATQLQLDRGGAYLGLWHNSKFKLFINNASPSLREVALVWHKAATTKAARTAELVNPLGPLGVQMTIGLFILRFKHTYDVLRERKGEGGGCVYVWERERERESLLYWDTHTRTCTHNNAQSDRKGTCKCLSVVQVNVGAIESSSQTPCIIGKQNKQRQDSESQCATEFLWLNL